MLPPGLKQCPRADAAPANDRAALISYVNQKIDMAKRYPDWARQRGYEGDVLVSFRILPDGSVAGVTVLKPSASDILNRAALEAIERAVPFNAGPIRLERELEFKIVIGFKLKK